MQTRDAVRRKFGELRLAIKPPAEVDKIAGEIRAAVGQGVCTFHDLMPAGQAAFETEVSIARRSLAHISDHMDLVRFG